VSSVCGRIKDEYEARAWKIFDAEDLKTPPGPRLTEIIDTRISQMAARYSATYPSTMKCLTTDEEELTACLRFPAAAADLHRNPGAAARSGGRGNRHHRGPAPGCPV
jgi:hypothetical protein